MATLLTKLNKLLSAKLPAFQSGLDYAEGSERVIGFVVSTAFSSTDHRTRQKKLRSILEQELSDEDMARIGPIVTMNPAEADVGRNAA